MPANVIYDPRSSKPIATNQELSQQIQAIYAASSGRYHGTASPSLWALQPDTLGFLEALVDYYKPAAILEFGSGESTAVLGRWAANTESRLFSVESDARWVETVRSKTSPADLRTTTQIHAPLEFRRRGVRLFLTYCNSSLLETAIKESKIILIDGPHFSGREDVLYLTLSHCSPGTTILVDDYNVYCVRDMLRSLTKSRLAGCFVAAELTDNSHGLCVLQTTRRTDSPVVPPSDGPITVLRSYWRSWRDWRLFGRREVRGER